MGSSRTWFFVLLACACVGCASDGGGTPHAPAASNLLVSIDGGPEGFAKAATEQTKKRLGALAPTFTQGDATPGTATLRLRLTYRNMPPEDVETIWAMTTYILATVYPSTCAHRTYTLFADLTDGAGRSRSFEQSDNTVGWVWLLVGPHCGEVPTESEVESVTDRLLDVVYDRMQRADAFGGAKWGESTNAPLVLVSSNRADQVVQQVLRVDRPFERWTTADDPQTPPDYRVTLHFEARGGNFSPKMYRFMAALMTAGIATMCNSTTITVFATVSGPSLARTPSDVRSKSVRGRMDPSGSGTCAPQDEYTRPEVYAELSRQVFAKIARAGWIPARLPDPGERPEQAPLVRIRGSVQSEAIVMQETIRSRPFRRYAFAFATLGLFPADYELTVNVGFSGGGIKPGVVNEVATGLSGPFASRWLNCAPTHVTLVATLTDAGGADVSQYRIEKTVPTTGSVDAPAACYDDAGTNPKVVAELVRELYRRMKQDGTLARLDHPPAA